MLSAHTYPIPDIPDIAHTRIHTRNLPCWGVTGYVPQLQFDLKRLTKKINMYLAHYLVRLFGGGSFKIGELVF